MPGVYYCGFALFHLEPLQCAIFKNDVVEVGTIIGDQLSATVASNLVLLIITEFDMLEPTPFSPTGFAAKINLRNHSSYAPLIHSDGHQGSGSQIDQSNLNLVLFRICDRPIDQ
jgi:hypothetical protein